MLLHYIRFVICLTTFSIIRVDLWSYIILAFKLSMALWTLFLIFEEIFISYTYEARQIRLFILEMNALFNAWIASVESNHLCRPRHAAKELQEDKRCPRLAGNAYCHQISVVTGHFFSEEWMQTIKPKAGAHDFVSKTWSALMGVTKIAAGLPISI